MSVTVSVVGYRPPSEEYKKMFTVHEACMKAGVSLPHEVQSYFSCYDPEPTRHGMYVDISEAVIEVGNTSRLVDISKLPAGVRLIEFRNSW